MLRFGKIAGGRELAHFTRQLSTLLHSGVPLRRSLEILVRQEKNPAFRKVIAALLENVETGDQLSDGLRRYPKVFNLLYLNMVRAGEAGGALETILSRLSRFLENNRKTINKVRAALFYPAVVVTVSTLIVALLMVFVIPRFQTIYSGFLGGASLPPLTQFLIRFSFFLKENWIWGVLLLAVFFPLVNLISHRPGGRKFLDRLKLRIPLLGEVAAMAVMARFSRTLGTLLESGVPILRALRITGEVTGNTVFRDALETVHDQVRDGESLFEPLRRTRVFPDMVTSMIEVGEETGDLASMLSRMGDAYEEDLDNAVSNLTAIIEPAAVILLALFVGVIVVALFLPIVSIIENLSGG